MEVSLNEIRKGFAFLITNKSICIEGKITKANENAPYNMQFDNSHDFSRGNLKV